LKPSLKYNVGQDLNDLRNTLVGVIHSAFSLNCKVRELTNVGLKNHHSTTTSHVRFVMKMAKSLRKNDAAQSKVGTEKNPNEVKMQAAITALQKENKDLKSYLQRLESKLDSVISKNDLEVATKNSASKRSRAGGTAATRDTAGEEKSSN
jgi:septal ring factor EnvC (AmiA/AmiB activator)